ncbi:MAG: tyrosine-type recombinase/integrase [Salibacteraceae bacterium]
MQPKTIRLTKDQHHSQEILKLEFEYNKLLIEKVKALGCKWSQTKKCWYLPFEQEVYKKVIGVFKDVAWVDASALFNGQKPEEKKGVTVAKKKEKPPSVSKIVLPEEYIDKLKRKRYSESTIKTYCSLFKHFMAYVSPIPIEEATTKDINGYLDYIVNKRKLAASSQNQIINAIKFYYEQVLGREKQYFEIDRPLKSKELPHVLSESQIQAILKATKNLKHKTILGLLYSGGLRNGELINLRLEDILWDQNLIMVRGGKGKKDRTTLLAHAMKKVLKVYLKNYKPKLFLIEGPEKQNYSQSSVRRIFQNSLSKAGIIGKFRVHDLRHSFATHLIEKGINLRYVQELLGHGSSKTTEIYTHVAKTKFNEIKNPLDNLF